MLLKEYNIVIPNYTEFEKRLQKETVFFKYMELLKEALPNYVLIIAVMDTPSGSVYTPAHAEAMINALGLKMNMINAFRMPYIAVIDHGNLVYESTSNSGEEPVIVNGTLGTHSLSVYSGGFACDWELGVNAAITIDGKRYYGNRGYNFFLYKIKEDYMADISSYEAFDNNNSGIYALHRPSSIIKELIANLPTRGGVILLFQNSDFYTLTCTLRTRRSHDSDEFRLYSYA